MLKENLNSIIFMYSNNLFEARLITFTDKYLFIHLLMLCIQQVGSQVTINRFPLMLV